jgi:hypothetical protein
MSKDLALSGNSVISLMDIKTKFELQVVLEGNDGGNQWVEMPPDKNFGA